MRAGGAEGKRSAKALFLLYLDAVSVVATRRAQLRAPQPADEAPAASGRCRAAISPCVEGACAHASLPPSTHLITTWRKPGRS